LFPLIMKVPPPLNQLIQVDYTMLLMLGCAGVAAVLARKVKSRLGGWDLLVVLMCCVFLFIGARGTSATSYLRTIVQITLSFGLPYFIFSRGMGAVRDPVRLLLPLIFSACVLAAIAAFEGLRHWLLYDSMNFGADQDLLSGYLKARGGYLRARATFSDSTSLSLFLGLAVVMSVALRRRFGDSRLLPLLLSFLALGLVFSFARVGLVVTAAGLLALLWIERRRVLFAGFIAAAPAVWIGMTILGSAFPLLGAAFGLTQDASAGTDYRQQLAIRILDVVKNHPLLGISNGEVQVRLADLRQGEGIIDLINTPLSVALESGIIGLVIFLLPSAVALLALHRQARRGDIEARSAAAAAFSAMCALQAGLLTTSLWSRNPLWLILLIALAAGLSTRSAAKAPTESAPRKKTHVIGVSQPPGFATMRVPEA
jgi:O-antigen ligase